MDKKEHEEIQKRLEKIEKDFSNTNEFFNNKLLIEHKKNRNQKIVIICITLILIFSLLLNAFTIYQLSQYEKVVEETTYEVKQENDGDSSINNVNGNQYNDNATHNENKENK